MSSLAISSIVLVLSTIIYDSDPTDLKKCMMEFLTPSIKDSQPVYSRKTTMKLLALNTKGKEIINVIDILTSNFMPNYNTEDEKAQMLGYSVRKLLLTRFGIIKETDRDSYVNKRVDLAGSLLLELYRELWGIFKKNLTFV